MKHMDLFSGIGGFALATEMVWGKDIEHVFCDNELFAQEIIKKHWPNSKIYGDIRTLTAHAESQRKLELAMERKSHKKTTKSGTANKGERIDLLTGGFPCQPFSAAGKRKGTADDRHLWPEMLRVIREFKPRWVIAENVGGLVTWNKGMVLEQVHVDLESAGYQVQAFIIPAVSLNAPHRRDRVWIVANTASTGSKRRGGVRTKRIYNEKKWGKTWSKDQRHNWDEPWTEVAAALCRVDDGIPRRLDRTPRFKGLGNAIVPQVAAQIMQVIKETEESL